MGPLPAPAPPARPRREPVLGGYRRRLATLDTRLLRRALRSHSPRVDVVMRIASTCANNSRLWLATAAGLSAVGGSTGRRAATRALLGVGIASAIVNGPLKLILRRQRPAAELLGHRAGLVRMPKSSSFPSGHSASAAAFATGIVREWPTVGVPVAGAAALVAYSRVHTGVHFPGDVLAGVGIGVVAGIGAGALLGADRSIALPGPEAVTIPRTAVVLTSVNAGSAGLLDRSRSALRDIGIEIVEEIPVQDKDRLAKIVDVPPAHRPLVIAAGGDGTVGAAAGQLVGTGAVMGIVPLGTSNDVARSLGISADPVRAVRQLRDGVVRAIDAGQVTVPGQPPHTFLHAATVGFNVRFAQIATQSSLRRRFGRFTYAVAGVRALRQHEPFECELSYEGTHEKLMLVQLSIINAPVFGGSLDLRVPHARLDDRSLIVIAVEPGSAVRLLAGALGTVLGRRRAAAGVRAVRTKALKVHVDRPVDVALDGEITSTLPADFEAVADALRVVTPRLKHDRA